MFYIVLILLRQLKIAIRNVSGRLRPCTARIPTTRSSPSASPREIQRGDWENT